MVLLTPSEAATAESPVRQFETGVIADNRDLKVLGRGQISAATRGAVTLVVQSFDLEDSDIGRHTGLYALAVERGRRARDRSVQAGHDAFALRKRRNIAPAEPAAQIRIVLAAGRGRAVRRHADR